MLIETLHSEVHCIMHELKLYMQTILVLINSFTRNKLASFEIINEYFIL